MPFNGISGQSCVNERCQNWCKDQKNSFPVDIGTEFRPWGPKNKKKDNLPAMQNQPI